MGILHPEVLKKYGINYAGSYLELNFDKLHELMNNWFKLISIFKVNE